MHKIGKSGEFLGRVLWPLIKTEFHLMKNVLKQLAKIVLIPLELTAGASTTDAAIHKKYSLFVWIWYKGIDNFELRNEWYHENS